MIRMSASWVPAWVVTRRAAGSIAVTVSRRTRTPGGEIPVGQPCGVHRCSTEHHVELRIPEDERVRFVDERDRNGVAERLGERRAELEPTKAGAEDEDTERHIAITTFPRV
jgi:hypothetical protein